VFKLVSEFHHFTSDTLQMFKVKGQRSRLQGQRWSSWRNVSAAKML